MHNIIKKSIAELKKDIGIYYHIPNFNQDIVINHKNSDDFMIMWHRAFYSFVNIEETISFFYSLIKGDYLNTSKIITIEEKLNSQYAKWFSYDQCRSVFTDLDSAKSALFKKLKSEFSLFMRNVKQTWLYEMLNGNSFLRKIALKKRIGEKLNFLIENEEIFNDKKMTDFIKIAVVREYENDQEKVIIPENWDLFNQTECIDFLYIQDDLEVEEIKKITGCLWQASYDRENKSIRIIFKFKSKNGDIYNYPLYSFDKDRGRFFFCPKNIGFNNEHDRGKLEELVAYRDILMRKKRD